MSDFLDGANADASTKARLRTDILSRRRGLTTRQIGVANERIGSALRRFIDWRAPRLVAGYAPVGTEPGGSDLPQLLADLVGGAERVLLPILLPDRDLDWARLDDAGLTRSGDPAQLSRGAAGLREPTGRRLGPTAVADADLVVVPALAVDLQGVRLGRGGGSYDRALARVHPGVAVVALVHDGEVLPDLPAQPHDRPVSAVVTPAGLRWLGDHRDDRPTGE
ncbi:5-formyltetrahydrofolate cyclo-ligase [Micromonospora sp. NBC_01813]|uniref:5-formyltetrahydrofolate cyclo-ligase n=1 Tax=Micromonospora sp. NBC_01813 TaxID=2975988 RepID=UPI002DD9EACE|nr:5-formyltetrahydrofolate cyclo-ligase [Micromonospora sp. NBC_01813]WSA06408.1 5-formyltetrahydrofolate cyclo-ligase [Micromonospora sp. NBC_01813]